MRRRGSLTISLCLATVAVTVLGLTAEVARADFVAYNDVVWLGTAPVDNATRYNIGSGAPGPTFGLLKDWSTGTNTAVTATFSQNGGVIWQPDPTTGGSDCNTGTDAYNYFNPTTSVSLAGLVYYGSTGWWVEIAFSGLDPTKTYEFVTSTNRNNSGSSYLTRLTKYTISDVLASTNSSSTGVTVGDGGLSTTFCSGYNTVNGYVARWTGITSGPDGDFVVRAEATPSNNSAYAFSAFKLVETPEPAALSLLALAALALRRR